MKLTPGLMKQGMDWRSAANTAEKALLYGAGTAAVGAGSWYLYDKRSFKDFIHDYLAKMQKNLEMEKAQKGEDNNSFFKYRSTVTPTGPGRMVSAGPVSLAGHLGGIGGGVTFNKDTVASALGKVPFMNKADVNRIVKPMPPTMYAGVDVGLVGGITPGLGVVKDPGQKKETIKALKHARKLLKDPDLEKKIDKRVYNKVREIGRYMMPAALSKGASMSLNKKAFQMGYMNKTAMDKEAVIGLDDALAIAGLAASVYGASKHIPGAYKAIKKKEKWNATKNIAMLGVDALGVAGTAGTVAKGLGKGFAALGGALKAGTTAKGGVMATAAAGEKAVQVRNAFEAAKALKAAKATQEAIAAGKAAGTIKPGVLEAVLKSKMVEKGLGGITSVGKSIGTVAEKGYAPVGNALKAAGGALNTYVGKPIAGAASKYIATPVAAGYNYAKYAPMHYGAKALPVKTARNFAAGAIRASRTPAWDKAQVVSKWMAKHPYTAPLLQQSMSQAVEALPKDKEKASPKSSQVPA
jgi:hypothetical protein